MKERNSLFSGLLILISVFSIQAQVKLEYQLRSGREGLDGARPYISMIKIVAPKMAQEVADRAMQIFGGMGVCQDTLIPEVFTIGRFCRIADGPDEVHMSQLGKLTARELTA